MLDIAEMGRNHCFEARLQLADALAGYSSFLEANPSHYLAPQAVGEALFGRYALAVEVVSFQLLFATIGAYMLGRPLPKGEDQ